MMRMTYLNLIPILLLAIERLVLTTLVVCSEEQCFMFDVQVNVV